MIAIAVVIAVMAVPIAAIMPVTAVVAVITLMTVLVMLAILPVAARAGIGICHTNCKRGKKKGRKKEPKFHGDPGKVVGQLAIAPFPLDRQCTNPAALPDRHFFAGAFSKLGAVAPTPTSRQRQSGTSAVRRHRLYEFSIPPQSGCHHAGLAGARSV